MPQKPDLDPNANYEVVEDLDPNAGYEVVEEDIRPDFTSQVIGEVSRDEPDTWWGGVARSLNPFSGGEALRAGLEGAKGYARGATLDIPSSIASGVSSLGSFASDVLSDPTGYASKVGGALADPMAVARGIGVGAKSVGQSILSAGSQPEEFGRTVGQITGQPLVTAGLAPHVPAAIRAAGTPVEATGRIVRKYQPVSGMIPFGGLRTVRNIERGVGRGVETIGRKMKSISTTPPNPVSQMPLPAKPGEVPPVIGQKALPPSNVRSYQPSSSFADEVLDAKGIPVVERPYTEADYAMDAAFEEARTRRGTGQADEFINRANEIMYPPSDRRFPNRRQVVDPRFRSEKFAEATPEELGLTPDAEMEAILSKFEEGGMPKAEVVDEIGPNASGESAASQEAISRNVGMRERGEKYVVYDQAGNKRDLIGPDAVDFVTGRGQTYGIEKADGTFIKLEDKGGKVTATRQISPKRREYPGFKGVK